MNGVYLAASLMHVPLFPPMGSALRLPEVEQASFTDLFAARRSSSTPGGAERCWTRTRAETAFTPPQ